MQTAVEHETLLFAAIETNINLDWRAKTSELFTKKP